LIDSVRFRSPGPVFVPNQTLQHKKMWGKYPCLSVCLFVFAIKSHNRKPSRALSFGFVICFQVGSRDEQTAQHQQTFRDGTPEAALQDNRAGARKKAPRNLDPCCHCWCCHHSLSISFCHFVILSILLRPTPGCWSSLQSLWRALEHSFNLTEFMCIKLN
jgi:hypothetical protein